MRPEQILGAVARYRTAFEANKIKKSEYPHDRDLGGGPKVLALGGLTHAHFMLDEIEHLVGDGLIEDAMRWLGFVQGILWTAGWHTITDFRRHNGTGEIQE